MGIASSFFTVHYMIMLLPATVLLYGLLPQKGRRVILLAASYIFFFAICGKLLIFLLLSTLSIHHIGIWLATIQRERKRRLEQSSKEEKKKIRRAYQTKQKRVLLFALLLHMGILLLLKYGAFFSTNLNTLFEAVNISARLSIPVYALPIGISFYTLQAIAYILDVYYEKMEADTNLFRLAIFMSFFPQILEGPICRYGESNHQLWNAAPIQFDYLSLGLQRILFGLVKKIVIADRLNLFIQTIFTNPEGFDGGVIAVVAVCYTIQLYMDFSGTIDVALGSAQIFGIALPENFKNPFFSKSISEFWARWHISLGAWFKDYIFYPLSMSKPLKKMTSSARNKFGNRYGPLAVGSVALLVVWICNGLWHGAGWQYIFFGMYHFTLILAGSLIEPLVKRFMGKNQIYRDTIAYQAMQILRTSILVCIGELFFRANGLKNGLLMMHKIVTEFSLESFYDVSILTLGFDGADVFIIVVTLFFILWLEIAQEKGLSIFQKIHQQKLGIRFIIFYAVIMYIIIFGAYGKGYVPVDPIYANF